MQQTNEVSKREAFIQAGRAALQAGDPYVARKNFRQATEIDPKCSEAWFGLAQVARPLQEKREHLQRALSLAPTNAEFQAALAEVERQLAAGKVLAPLEPPAPPVPIPPVALPEITTDYCYWHPKQETGLYCTQCNKPICAACLRPAAVGQLCPTCAQERRPPNYQVGLKSLVLAALVSFFSSSASSFLLVRFLSVSGFFAFFLSLMLASLCADLLVRVLDRLTRTKRGKMLQITVGISFGLGAAPFLFLSLSLSLLLFTIMAISTAISRLR